MELLWISQNMSNGVGELIIFGEQARTRVDVRQINAALASIDNYRRTAEHAFINRFV